MAYGEYQKQVLEALEKDLEYAQDALYRHMTRIFEEGDELWVKRGNGEWDVTFLAADNGDHAGYFRARSRTGKIHTFHFSQIIL